MAKPLAVGEVPKRRNFGRDRWQNILWRPPLNHRRLLWHFHCSSSILFCVLVSLNLLDGVVPFSERRNDTERQTEKYLNVTKKSEATNGSSDISKSNRSGGGAIAINDEDELTREILALFDYDDKWTDKKGTAENGEEKKDQWNGTNVNWTSTNLETELLQFSMDPAESQLNLTDGRAIGDQRQGNAIGNGLENASAVDNSHDRLLSNDSVKAEEKMATSSSSTSTSATSSAHFNVSSISEENNLETVANETEIKTTQMAPKVGKDEQTEEMPNEETQKVNVSAGGGEAMAKMEKEDKKETTERTEKAANRTGKIESIATSLFFGTLTAFSRPIAESILNNGTATLSLMNNSEKGLNETWEEFGNEFTNETMTPNGTQMATTTLESIGKEKETEKTAKNQTENGKSISTTNTSTSATEVLFSAFQSELPLAFSSSSTTHPTALARTNLDANGTINEAESDRQIEQTNGTSAGEGVKEALEELERRVEGKMRIGDMEFVELNEYRQHLRQILSDVESVLSKWPGQLAHSDFPKSRRFIAISASMPNRNSDLFIARKNAISASVTSNFEEIRKSPIKLGTTTANTAKMEEQMVTEIVPMLATTEKAKRGKAEGKEETMGRETIAHQGKIVEEEKKTEGVTDKKRGKALLEEEKKREEETTTTKEKSRPSGSMEPIGRPVSSESNSDERPPSNNPRTTGFFRAEHFSSKYFFLTALRNNSAVDHCKHLAQDDLVRELKQKGTYNPELMAWDVSGVFRFLDKTITDQYERQSKPPKSSDQAVKRNIEALERLLSELNLRCDVRSPEVLSRLGNLTMNESKRSIISPSLRQQKEQFQLIRRKRSSVLAQLVGQRDEKRHKRGATNGEEEKVPKGGRKQQRKQKQKMIGDVHAVPFGCDKRGDSEDGYLRLCGACQSIRKLPEEFFPPFINEVVCDEDKACLYFYDYPHGKCKQKHMNFVVLKNVGTPLCQIWEKFNLNVRVSCECFVDEMSFFSKYV